MNKIEIIKEYRKDFIKRYDDNHIIKYFSHNDFQGLNAKRISFESSNLTKINGYIYNYDNYNKNQLIIFCHGIGGGHLSYMKEINYFCEKGFQVLAYDNTGCMESEGKDINSLCQSLIDLNSCINMLEKDDNYKNLDLIVVGHSWGGYACGNILHYHKQIKKVVIISGFVSVKELLNVKYNNKKKKIIYKYEKDICGKYLKNNIVNSIKNTKSKVLYIQSIDDDIVPKEIGISYIEKYVKNDNVTILIMNNKYHNPTYTNEAVKYMREVFGLYNKKIENNEFLNDISIKNYFQDVDWNKMTTLDIKVMNFIIDFIS